MRQPEFQDCVICNVTVWWPWWVRPWLALRVLLGARVHVSARVETENVVGATRTERTVVSDFIPWWPRPRGGFGAPETESDGGAKT